ncbi:tetratricopeptide repeat protein [Candidatus Poribacteria bacterium]|nr:tetratricopeptide repeat protein [Candidatus Poribacteria bacterium]
MKQNSKSLLVLLALSFLLSGARTPQQLVSPKPEAPIVSVTSEKLKGSVVRIVGLLGTKVQSGSGFFVAQNEIVTNIHVVAHRGPIFAKLVNKETVWAVEGVTAYDVKNDLVVLKITGEGTPLPLGDSDAVRRGETISVVGFPRGRYKVVTGTVLNTRNSDRRIRTTADTVTGNSGGPLLNSKGQVIGIHVARDEAIPSNALKALLSQSTQVEPIEQWHKRKLIRAYAYFMLGKTKFAAKDYDNGMIDLDKAIQMNPELIYAYYGRGLAKSELGDYNGAIADYDRYIELNSGDAEAYYRRGQAKKALGQHDAARADFQKAKELDPNIGGND